MKDTGIWNRIKDGHGAPNGIIILRQVRSLQGIHFPVGDKNIDSRSRRKFMLESEGGPLAEPQAETIINFLKARSEEVNCVWARPGSSAAGLSQEGLHSLKLAGWNPFECTGSILNLLVALASCSERRPWPGGDKRQPAEEEEDEEEEAEEKEEEKEEEQEDEEEEDEEEQEEENELLEGGGN